MSGDYATWPERRTALLWSSETMDSRIRRLEAPGWRDSCQTFRRVRRPAPTAPAAAGGPSFCSQASPSGGGFLGAWRPTHRRRPAPSTRINTKSAGSRSKRQVEVNPQLQRCQRGMIREIHNRPADAVPSSAEATGAFATEIGKLAAAEPPGDHQAASPCAMRPRIASTCRVPDIGIKPIKRRFTVKQCRWPPQPRYEALPASPNCGFRFFDTFAASG